MRVCRFMFVVLMALLAVNRAQAQQTLTCSSEDGKRHYCNANTGNGVQMTKQRSGSPCVQNQTWGYDDRGVWVDRGCRADFSLGGNMAPQTITCSSDDGDRHHCRADTSNGVRLVQQISGSPCTAGKSWGFDQGGIWVDKGCRAQFSVGPENGYGNGYGNGNGGGGASTMVRCASDDGGRHYCSANTTNAQVRMVKQISGSSCVEGTTWGFDGRGIWVDRGCRADFSVTTGRRYGNNPGYDDAAQGRTCAQAVGQQRANQLVQQCLQVSPGTHPPCNAQNSCKMITDEIRRSCRMIGTGSAPGFCDEYR